MRYISSPLTTAEQTPSPPSFPNTAISRQQQPSSSRSSMFLQSGDIPACCPCFSAGEEKVVRGIRPDGTVGGGGSRHSNYGTRMWQADPTDENLVVCGGIPEIGFCGTTVTRERALKSKQARTPLVDTFRQRSEQRAIRVFPLRFVYAKQPHAAGITRTQSKFTVF